MPTDSGSKKRKTDADGKLQDEAMSGAASDVNTSKKVRNGTHPDHGSVVSSATTKPKVVTAASPPVHSFFAPRLSAAAATDTTKVRRQTQYPDGKARDSLEHWTWKDPGRSSRSNNDETIASASSSSSAVVTTMCTSSKKPSIKAKLALYDLDGTLIKTKSGRPFPKDESDWNWWDVSAVKRKLSEMRAEGYDIVVISNQKLVPAKLDKWRKKFQQICQDLPDDVPLRVLAATGDDEYRKPRVGMYEVLESVYADKGMEIDKDASFYVGDAAGRQGDHSDTDRKWAINAKLKFMVPEEHFRGLVIPPMQFGPMKHFDAKRALTEMQLVPAVTPTTSPIVPKDTREIVLFVGFPASGKTTFYQTHFRPRGYTHVNQDTLKTRDKCLDLVRDTLRLGEGGCVVDNTNRDKPTRALYVQIARQLRIPIRCFFFTAGFALARHNNAYRAWCAKNVSEVERRKILPDSAFGSFQNSMQPPEAGEGFDEIRNVNFKFAGDEDDLERWSRWMF